MAKKLLNTDVILASGLTYDQACRAADYVKSHLGAVTAVFDEIHIHGHHGERSDDWEIVGRSTLINRDFLDNPNRYLVPWEQ